MKRTRTRALAALACMLSTASVAANDDDGVRHMSAADIEKGLAPLAAGVAIGPIPSGPGATAIAARRDRTGEVELHEVLADILVDENGDATLLVGGRITGNHQTAAGEWRGGTIEGGRTFSFRPGDVVWIPAGVPHQMILQPGAAVTYLAFKFSRPATP